MNLFKLLTITRDRPVILRPIVHLTTDLRRPRDAKRFALKCKALAERSKVRTFPRRQAN